MEKAAKIVLIICVALPLSLLIIMGILSFIFTRPLPTLSQEEAAITTLDQIKEISGIKTNLPNLEFGSAKGYSHDQTITLTWEKALSPTQIEEIKKVAKKGEPLWVIYTDNNSDIIAQQRGITVNNGDSLSHSIQYFPNSINIHLWKATNHFDINDYFKLEYFPNYELLYEELLNASADYQLTLVVHLLESHKQLEKELIKCGYVVKEKTKSRIHYNKTMYHDGEIQNISHIYDIVIYPNSKIVHLMDTDF